MRYEPGLRKLGNTAIPGGRAWNRFGEHVDHRKREKRLYLGTVKLNISFVAVTFNSGY